MAKEPRIPKVPKAKKRSAFVLMVGDDGAILVQTQGRRVIRRLFALSPEPQHSEAFDETLKAFPRSAVTMLVDLTDQSYIRQTLPPVSSLSVGKIIKRRIEKDFPPDDINGYRMLGHEKTGRKDWSYLMVSLANSPLLQKWTAFAAERSNPFRGIGVLPLEAEPLLLAIDKALSRQKAGSQPKEKSGKLTRKKGKDPQSLEWQMLVSHHKVGGFRQIVLRGEKLVFTRMAQMVGESLPEVMAGNVEQEMLNTLEYLKRLGLQDLGALSVVIVAAAEIRQALDPKKINSGEYHCMTPAEIAALLGIPDAAQTEDHFGDVVMSAFIASRRKLILPLHTPYTRKLAALSRYLGAMRVTGILSALALIVWIGMSGWDIYGVWQDIEKVESDQQQFQGKLNAIRAKANALPKEIKNYTDIMTLSQLFDKRRSDPLSFLSILVNAMENGALVTDYAWTLADPLSVTKDADRRMTKADFSLRLTSPHEPASQYAANAAMLMERIRHYFHDYAVTNSELPGSQSLDNNKDLQTTIDDTGNHIANAAMNAQIETVKVTIEGPKPETRHGR